MANGKKAEAVSVSKEVERPHNQATPDYDKTNQEYEKVKTRVDELSKQEFEKATPAVVTAVR